MVKTAETETEDLKKYDSVCDNLKARDDSASKKHPSQDLKKIALW